MFDFKSYFDPHAKVVGSYNCSLAYVRLVSTPV